MPDEQINKPEGLKNKVTKGLFWSYLERFSSQIVTLIISIVLSRLISPEGHGIIAIVYIFINISEVFVTSGFGNALVQKKNADELDFSSIFYCSLGVSLIIYLILFLGAPLISRIYKNDALTALIRVTGVQLFFSSFNTIQRAYVSRRLEFKKFFTSTFFGTVASAIIGIGMAYNGFGPWALVGQYLSNCFIKTLTLFFIVDWKPRLMFSFERAKGLIRFGWKLLASALLESLYTNLRSLIIGVKFSETDLAYYDKGKHFPEIVVNNVNASIVSVIFPAIANVQDDKERVRLMTKRSVQISIYIMTPLIMGLLAVSRPLVSVLLTDVWLPCVPFMRIACLNCLLYPIHTANLQPVKALGRSDIYLRLEIIKKIVGVAILAGSVLLFNSVEAIAWGTFVYSLACLVINSSHNKQLFGYGLLEEFRDMLPSILLGGAMVASVFAVSLLGLSPIVCLIVQVPVGAAVYLGLSRLTKYEAFSYVLDIVRKLFKRKEKTA